MMGAAEACAAGQAAPELCTWVMERTRQRGRVRNGQVERGSRRFRNLGCQAGLGASDRRTLLARCSQRAAGALQEALGPCGAHWQRGPQGLWKQHHPSSSRWESWGVCLSPWRGGEARKSLEVWNRQPALPPGMGHLYPDWLRDVEKLTEESSPTERAGLWASGRATTSGPATATSPCGRHG